MRFSRYIVLSFLVSLITVPLLAQVSDTYVIPVSANASGANNTRWKTQFHVFNPQSYPLRVSLIFLPSNGGSGLQRDIDVEPNMTSFSDNILNDAFNTGGSGALVVATFPELNPTVPDSPLDRSFVVSSNTFNDSRDGTYGQLVPGVFTGLFDYEFDGITALAPGVINYGTPGVNGFRTNIGAVNLGRYSVKMWVTVFDSSGDVIARDIPFLIPPQGHIQDRLPVTVQRGSIEFLVDDPSQDAVVFPYASVVDNKSGDPLYVSPILLASASVLYKNRNLTELQVGRRITTADARKLLENVEHRGILILETKGGMRAVSQ